MFNPADAWAFAEWDAVETSLHVRQRHVTAAEMVEAAIVRAIDAEALGGLITPTFERAREQASRAAGGLVGVPSVVTDLVAVRGVVTTWGSAGARRHHPRLSSPDAVALERCGLITLGKSATAELGLSATTEPLAFGPARNPWNPLHSAGGASGGSATLVAAGVVHLAHATDSDGSARIPAACCGLVALKPSRGRFDVRGAGLLPINLSVNAVLTRSVRDTVAFWRALELERPCEGLPRVDPTRTGRRLRVGVYFDTPQSTPVDADVRFAAEQVAIRCRALGHDVEPIVCPIPSSFAEDFLLYQGFLAWGYRRAARLVLQPRFDASKLEPWTFGLAEHFARHKVAALLAMRRLRAFEREWAQRVEGHDVLLGPTLAQPAPLLGVLSPDRSFELLRERFAVFSPWAAAVNVAGAPALTIPAMRCSDGLPLGVQLSARWGQESVLLELALELEEAEPWTQLAPRRAWGDLP